MSKTRTTLGIIVGLAILIPGALALLTKTPPSQNVPTVTDRPGAPNSSWNWTKRYRLAITTVVVGPSGRGGTTLEGHLSVRGLLDPAAGGQNGRLLGLQLGDLTVRLNAQRSPDLERAYAGPFVAQIDERGRLGSTRFTEATAPGDRLILDALLRSLEIILPQGGGSTWTEDEQDQQGRYRATYAKDAFTGAVTKKKLRYQASSQPHVVVTVDESTAQAVPDPAGHWLERLEVRERLSIGPPGATLAKTEASIALEPEADSGAPSLALFRGDLLAMANLPLSAAGGDTAWDRATAEREKHRLDESGLSADVLMAKLREPGKPDSALHRDLAALFRLRSDQPRRFANQIGALNDQGAALLCSALERAGTPDAQAALADIVQAGSRDNRMRALVAFGGVQHPDRDAVQFVTRAYHDLRGTSSLHAASTLALGTMARSAAPSDRAQIVQRLTSDLGAARAPEEQRLLLQAIGNAGADLPAGTLLSYAGASHDGVREAAAEMLGRRSEPAIRDEALRLFGAEPAIAVRGAFLAGLQARPSDGDTNAALAEVLSSGREPDPALRAQIATYLSAHSREFPGNRDVLLARLRSETDRHVLATMLGSLPPETTKDQ